MPNAPEFTNIDVLIADNDALLAQVLLQNLRAIGFPKVQHVRDGSTALQYIQNNPVDLLITEWDMPPYDGLELIERLRRLNSPKRGIPIIMLTGKGELQHVSTARDVGITEFVVKPFSAQTLFRRIEQIADHPRGFVMSDNYVGPDRRRKDPKGKKDSRRVAVPTEVDPATGIQRGIKMPAIIKPSGAFKKNLGIAGPLASVITPDVLAEAQKTIDAMVDESIGWLKEDITTLMEAHKTMSKAPNNDALERAKQSALSIKARAGTFGFPLASDVGRLLYLFLCSNFNPTKTKHLFIFEKHLQTMQVIIAQRIKESDGIGAELVAELKKLVV